MVFIPHKSSCMPGQSQGGCAAEGGGLGSHSPSCFCTFKRLQYFKIFQCFKRAQADFITCKTADARQEHSLEQLRGSAGQNRDTASLLPPLWAAGALGGEGIPPPGHCRWPWLLAQEPSSAGACPSSSSSSRAGCQLSSLGWEKCREELKPLQPSL